MKAWSGNAWDVEGLGTRGISRERSIWGGGRAHGVAIRAEDTSSCTGGALLVGRWRFGDLALKRGLLLSAQDVPDVVRRPRATGSIWRSHMVRRASVGVSCSWVEARVLREVVGSPRTRVHHGWIPVHPRAGGSLMILHSVLWMSCLPADGQRRWCWILKLHYGWVFPGALLAYTPRVCRRGEISFGSMHSTKLWQGTPRTSRNSGRSHRK